MLRRSVSLSLSLIGLAAVPACVGSIGQDNEDDCYKHVQRSFRVTLPSEDPGIEYTASVCRVDADKCLDLCTTILTRLQVNDAQMATCAVKFEAAEANVDMTYEVFLPEHSNCFVPMPVEDF